ncbi:MAG: XRE family transcriptional regulator [Hymenobacter sp.]|nr:MAG: XRE family transcriptional regulator [Hymenobacter sp.]
MSGDPVKAFGLVVRELRQSLNWSQEVLAEETGLDRTFISQLETGRKQPSLLTIFRLARSLQVESSYLLLQVEARLQAAD